jgi:hypothetical protein
MPYLFKGISQTAPQYQAWRWAFFVPGAMHVLVAVLILAFGQVPSCLPSCSASYADFLLRSPTCGTAAAAAAASTCQSAMMISEP